MFWNLRNAKRAEAIWQRSRRTGAFRVASIAARRSLLPAAGRRPYVGLGPVEPVALLVLLDNDSQTDWKGVR